MQKEIKHNVFFNHPPQDVWEYLTDAELLGQWVMKNDIKPVVGHQFRFMANPMPSINWDGVIYCTVLEIVPFKKFSYSWKSGPGDGTYTIDSLVEWTLHPKDNGTELALVHSGFKLTEEMSMFAALNGGWLSNMNKVVNMLNTKRDGAAKA